MGFVRAIGGTDEYVLAVDTGRLDAFADLLLIVVNRCSIDMSVAMPQRYLDGIFDLVRLGLLRLN